MDEKQIAKAVNECMKDGRRKAEADSAPSANASRHLSLELYYSYHDGYSAPHLSRPETLEVFAAMYELEDKFTAADWKHLESRSSGTFKRICALRRELVEAGSLSFPKWRYIYKYISKKNPFRAVAKERLDKFMNPDMYPHELTENRRMQDAIARAERNSRWMRFYDSCPGGDERTLMRLCAYFTENRTLGHFIMDLITLRYDKGGKAWEHLKDCGFIAYANVTEDEMFESVRF